MYFEPNLNPQITRDGDISTEKFEWRVASNNEVSTSREFPRTSTVSYSLTVYNSENGIEYSNYKEFTVTNPDAPNSNQIIVDSETSNNTIFISINENSNYNNSLDDKTFFKNGLNHTFYNVSTV